MNVLFVNFTHSKEKELRDQLYPHIPTDLLYHAASLHDYSYQFVVWNEQLSSYKELEQKLTSLQPLHYIFIKHLSHNAQEVLDFVKRVKSDNAFAKTSMITIGKQSDKEMKTYIDAGVEFCLFDELSANAGLFISKLNVPFNPFLDDISGLAFKNYFGDIRKNDLHPHPFQMKSVGEVLARFRLREYTDRWKYSYKKHGFPFMQLHLPHHSLAYSFQLFEKALLQEQISYVYLETESIPLLQILQELNAVDVNLRVDVYVRFEELNTIDIAAFSWKNIQHVWVNVPLSADVNWVKIAQWKRALREKGVKNVGLCFTHIDKNTGLKKAVEEFRGSELTYFFDDKHLPKWSWLDKVSVSLLFKYPFLTKQR